MSAKPFIFKKFIIHQDKCAMKVGTDSMILGAYVPANKATKILDIGSGTGILALMLAQKSGAQIDAVEIEENAYLQAKENFKNSDWSSQLEIELCPIQDFKPGTKNKYDLIISNPPYFERNEKSLLESEKYNERLSARSFESLSYETLLEEVARLITDTGLFYVIIPSQSLKLFTVCARNLGLFLVENLEIFSKENQLPVRNILCFSKIELPPKSDTFIIYEDDGNYTDAYIELTKDYYAVDMRERKRLSDQDI